MSVTSTQCMQIRPFNVHTILYHIVRALINYVHYVNLFPFVASDDTIRIGVAGDVPYLPVSNPGSPGRILEVSLLKEVLVSWTVKTQGPGSIPDLDSRFL